MYKLLSGAKSVKQYRGDENLPEAKKGMKNCGCKHPKSKYKYGTGALTIPEGSAIVTAKHGLGKRAVEAHLRGNDEEVENLIKKMPEDKPNGRYKKYKKQSGATALDVINVTKNPFYIDPYTKNLVENKKNYSWFQPFTSSNTEAGRTSRTTGISTLLNPNDEFNQYNNIGLLEKKAGRKFTSMEDLQGYIYDNMSEDQRKEMWDKYGPTLKSNEKTRENFIDKLGGARTAHGLGTLGRQTSTFNMIPEKSNTVVETKKEIPVTENKKETPEIKKKPNFDIPSLAEISAKASVLGQGVEGVPENYIKLDKYNYASQLPKTLREIQLAEQGSRESARDIVVGDAGRYLAQAGNLSAARMKAANDAVIQDTLARQDISNKNVDLGNVEMQTNRGLKDQYAQQRAMNRGAYNNMLVSLGQSIDTAADASKLMSNQRKADDQRLAILKSMADSGNYDIVTNPDGTMSYSVKQLPETTTTTTPVSKARGTKKLKTYKRR